MNAFTHESEPVRRSVQAAWNFSTLWLELNCFDNTQAATIVALYTVGQAIGQPFGGWLGDVWARRSPDYGRPAST